MSELIHRDYDKEHATLEELLNRLADAVLEVCAVHSSERVRFHGHEAHRARDSYMSSKKHSVVLTREEKTDSEVKKEK